ncbi:SDR family NAD(P)-dependent oxidoreductase [Streptomyces sp. WMMB 322]|uniref:SDR family NAD(P)-dependent oxidoreductase n=1 Tax=Streptomyces sp. WMMB 322 TaxID=1286821 RepID=UPI0006E2FDA1|nr:SDR family NAD(P)-dependent oxidoreductase [Streptomyces sp. WMMB 322]SCK45493.1 NAD(P)-dependent dehydrogenase, short-chain alcohol dehydrogenase family [Streptomyces sp. WMMB 322]
MTDTAPVSTPFTAESTADEVVAGIDLSGRRAVVTGGASGIGAETVRTLAGAGAQVTLAVRDVEAGRRAAAEIVAATGNEHVRVAPLDLTDRKSVAGFLAAWEGPLNILVNNAGVMASPLVRTPEGWELQFATNHLGHFALTVGLHRALAEAGGSRVVSVTSSSHLDSPVCFEDIHFRSRGYDPWAAYAQSKTANALFAVGAWERWESDGITVNSAMPGAVRTRLRRHVGEGEEAERSRARAGSGPGGWKTPGQGAATSVLLATSSLLEGVGGRCFEDCNQAPVSEPGSARGVAPFAVDPEAAARLWQISVETLTV